MERRVERARHHQRAELGDRARRASAPREASAAAARYSGSRTRARSSGWPTSRQPPVMRASRAASVLHRAEGRVVGHRARGERPHVAERHGAEAPGALAAARLHAAADVEQRDAVHDAAAELVGRAVDVSPRSRGGPRRSGCRWPEARPGPRRIAAPAAGAAAAAQEPAAGEPHGGSRRCRRPRPAVLQERQVACRRRQRVLLLRGRRRARDVVFEVQRHGPWKPARASAAKNAFQSTMPSPSGQWRCRHPSALFSQKKSLIAIIFRRGRHQVRARRASRRRRPPPPRAARRSSSRPIGVEAVDHGHHVPDGPADVARVVVVAELDAAAPRPARRGRAARRRRPRAPCARPRTRSGSSPA